MNTHGDVHIELENCPQCQVTKPLLTQLWCSPSYLYNNDKFDGAWSVYICSKCRRVILACAPGYEEIQDILPRQMVLPRDIPDRARRALSEAIKITGTAPSASIISCARAVEFMLDAKGIGVGTSKKLYAKIEEAAVQQIIIPDVKTWAHEIRLAANDERHPDLDDATPDDAQQCVEFALALAQNLFVLPARIRRGLDKVRVKVAAASNSSVALSFELKQQGV
jgi:hypothetical protein